MRIAGRLARVLEQRQGYFKQMGPLLEKNAPAENGKGRV